MDHKSLLEKSERVILLKIGNLFLHKKEENIEKKLEYNTCRPWSLEPKIEQEPPFLIDEIVNLFRKSSQTTKVKILGKKEDIRWRGNAFSPNVHWHFRPPLKFKLTIPVKNQKFTSDYIKIYGEEVETAEEFDVLYNGSCYFFLTELKNPRKQMISMIDCRDYILDLLNEEFYIEEVAPNPLRRDFYLCILKDGIDIPKVDRIFKDGDLPITYIATPKSLYNDDTLKSLIISYSHYLDFFYACSAINRNHKITVRDINDNYIELLNNIKNLRKQKYYNILEKNTIKREIENNLLNHYEYIIKTKNLENLINEGSSFLNDNIDRMSFLKKSYEELSDEIKYKEISHEMFNHCLAYSNSIIERYMSWDIAILTATIATMATLVITYGPLLVQKILSIFSS